MKILAIESSCDETAAAILEASGRFLKLNKNVVYSQVDLHKKYGGVVPELAARQHVETIIPILEESLGKNKLANIDYVAVTSGPGLVTSLILGIAAAKALAFARQVPLVSINHMEGHVYSNWLSNAELVKNDKKYFPALVLIVSGGHSELVLMKDHGHYTLLGQTLDDAVGEAYDKVAKLLDLGYPGGPIVSSLAGQGDATKYSFPRPMLDKNNYNFSFSGLKTAVLYTLEKKRNIKTLDVKDICAAFQEAVVEVLLTKTIKAAKEYKVKSLMIAGGVAANTALKKALQKEAKILHLPFFYPEQKYTGDNAAMIATAAYYNIKSKNNIFDKSKLFKVEAQSNWQLTKNICLPTGRKYK